MYSSHQEHGNTRYLRSLALLEQLVTRYVISLIFKSQRNYNVKEKRHRHGHLLLLDFIQIQIIKLLSTVHMEKCMLLTYQRVLSEINDRIHTLMLWEKGKALVEVKPQ